MALGVLLAACAQTGASLDGFGTTTIEIDGQQLHVALAEGSAQRARGLMEVEDLGGLDGMLFVYEQPRSASFTMFNTVLPLDAWWFDESGALIGSAEMEPCPEKPCTSYRSPGAVMWVLETPQGDYDFEIGSVLTP